MKKGTEAIPTRAEKVAKTVSIIKEVAIPTRAEKAAKTVKRM